MLRQYKDPILVSVGSISTLAGVETAINNALGSNPEHCLVDIIAPSGEMYYVLDEVWGTPNPVRSVVLEEVTAAISSQLASVLSSNPGYNLLEVRHFPSATAYAFVLGSS